MQFYINNVMNHKLYIADDFEIPSLNTSIETREIKGRDGFILGEKRVEGYNFPIPFHYVNHDRKDFQDIVNELVEFFNTNEEVRLRFEGEYWYWNVIFTGTIEFKQKTQGFVSFELNCIITDPFKYSNERYSTISQGDHLTLYNRGTAHTFPHFKLTAKKASTMLMLTKNDEDYFMIGEPEDVLKKNVNASPSIYSTSFPNIVGWSYINNNFTNDPYIGGHTGGTITNTNNSVAINKLPDDKTGWTGAAMKRSLPETMQDFDITVAVRIHSDWRSKSTGKSMVHLYDENGNVVAALGLLDASSERNVRLYVAVYDEYGTRKEICDYKHPMFNVSNSITHIRLIRVGNEYRVKSWRMIDWATYSKNDIYSTRFIDAGELYQKPVRQVGFFLSRNTLSQGNFTDPKLYYLRVRRPDGSKEDEIPYVVQAGDEVEINSEHEVVLVNGEPMNELKDFGSSYFSVDKNLTEVLIEPQNTFEASAEWSDRFY